MSAICESLSCSEAQLPLEQLIRMTLAKDADGCLGLRMISDGAGGGGGGTTTLFYNISETAAKTAITNVTLVPGALYGITLDGTSQGNADDIIYVTAIDAGGFAAGMTYFYATNLSLLNITGSFTASGFTLLKADEAASYTYAFDSSSNPTVDLSTVRMFGNIVLQDSSGGDTPVNFIGLITDDIITIKDNGNAAKIATADIIFKNGFVGDWVFLDYLRDYITIQSINGADSFICIDAYAAYTGGARRYVALLTQSGTDAPVATVLENTMGGVPSWSYDTAGNYYATLSGAFTIGKTIHLLEPQFLVTMAFNEGLLCNSGNPDANTITINTSGQDGWLSYTNFKIEVYP